MEIFVYINGQNPHLVVWLAANNFDSVPFLLSCALLQLVGSKETHAVQVRSVTTFRWRHEGRCDEKNLKEFLKLGHILLSNKE